MRPIRTAARALIIRNAQLLTIKMRDQNGVFYILPGGGQNHGENLKQGLARECIEEIGTEVRIGKLLYVREYIGKNHKFSETHNAFHQIEQVFSCELIDPSAIGGGTELDKKQIGVEWISLKEIANHRFLPAAIIPYFTEDGFHPPETYLGDVN